MKKIYTKPEAELVKFYSEEDITLDIDDYAMEDDTGDPRISGDYEVVEGDKGWT